MKRLLLSLTFVLAALSASAQPPYLQSPRLRRYYETDV